MAKIYTLELDGKIIKIESDVEPTENDVREMLDIPKPITADSTWGEVGSSALKNALPDASNLASDFVSMINPKNWQPMMEGMIDLSSAGMSKALDATGLSKYADPEKMDKYRKYRGVVADEFKQLATEEGLKKRLAEKPVTSLLDLSVIGRGISAPLKAQQYSATAQKIGNIIDTGAKAIDPTQLVTKPAGLLYDNLKTKSDLKALTMADVDAKNKLFTEQGFVIPPSKVEKTGFFKKTIEGLLGDNIQAKAIEKNQKIFNKKAREYTNVSEDTPLTKIINTISERQAPIYKEVKSLKPVVLKKSKTTKGKPEEIDTGFLDASGKPIMKTVTPKPSKTKNIYSRSGAEIFEDIQKLRKERGELYKKEKNKAQRDNVEVNYDSIDNVTDKLNKVENELEILANKSGNTDLLDNLQLAREDYARGFAVENSVRKGNLDAINFTKINKRNQKLVDGSGKQIMDFVDEYTDVSKPLPKKQIAEEIFDKVKPALAASAIGGINLAAAPYTIPAYFGAKQLVPELLLGKSAQKSLSSGNYMPSGSGLLNALSNRGAVNTATFIPSLLETTKAEYAPYLYQDEQ